MKLNIGSGQRRFEGHGWINCDCISRPDQVPDVLCDVGKEPLPYGDCTADVVVLHQVLEHFGCGEADALLRECNRVLRPGGALLIFLPNLRALAQRWLVEDITDYIYIVNLMGAYQGADGDRHKWHYTKESLSKALLDTGRWNCIRPFPWYDVPGSDFGRDWWVLAIEAVK